MAQWTTTYSGLIDLLQTYVEDTSDEFSSAVQGIVNRAEERVLRDLDLTIFDESTTSTTTISVAQINRPSSGDIGFVRWVRVNDIFLSRKSHDYIAMYGGSGQPLYFSETDTSILLAPTPDSSYTVEIKYTRRPEALSESNQENWVSEHAADALLAAALVESERFLIAPERTQEFEADYAKALGPLRALHRSNAAHSYDPMTPSASPRPTR